MRIEQLIMSLECISIKYKHLNRFIENEPNIWFRLYQNDLVEFLFNYNLEENKKFMKIANKICNLHKYKKNDISISHAINRYSCEAELRENLPDLYNYIIAKNKAILKRFEQPKIVNGIDVSQDKLETYLNVRLDNIIRQKIE